MKVHLSDGEWKLMNKLWDPLYHHGAHRRPPGGDRLVQEYRHHHALPAGRQEGRLL